MNDSKKENRTTTTTTKLIEVKKEGEMRMLNVRRAKAKKAERDGGSGVPTAREREGERE